MLPIILAPLEISCDIRENKNGGFYLDVTDENPILIFLSKSNRWEIYAVHEKTAIELNIKIKLEHFKNAISSIEQNIKDIYNSFLQKNNH